MEDFLLLLKEWEKLCIHFSLRKSPNLEEYDNLYGMTNVENDGGDKNDNKDDGNAFIIEEILGIALKNSKETTKKRGLKKIKKRGLYLKVLLLFVQNFTLYLII